MKNSKLAVLLHAMDDIEVDLLIDMYFSDFSWKKTRQKGLLSSEELETAKSAFDEMFSFCGNPSREEIQGTLVAHIAEEADKFIAVLDRVAPKLTSQPELPKPAPDKFSEQCTALNEQVLGIYKKLYDAISKYQ